MEALQINITNHYGYETVTNPLNDPLHNELLSNILLFSHGLWFAMCSIFIYLFCQYYTTVVFDILDLDFEQFTAYFIVAFIS